ncbi:MAG TPA: nitroreductase family deazaflavin-dependent oxidoreductase [Anaerolineales bacterium]|nr:nitroreductase family deazaflavin-dependent oxidoreductase [Anaerolineales bacterium]
MMLSTESEIILRKGFRSFNKFMLLLFRLGLGSYGNGTRWGGWIMVLSQRGRKTGLLRRTPLNYALVDGDVYCLAGFGAQADWYRNILANPEVEVWLVEGRWAGIAEDVSDHPQRLELLRKVLVASGFASYAAGIDPIKLDDESLDTLTQNYRLVRIRRKEARTGPGGPGDLAWVWPLATFILLPLALRKRRPNSKK